MTWDLMVAIQLTILSLLLVAEGIFIAVLIKWYRE